MDIRTDAAASPSISQASMPEVFSITIHPDRQFVWKSSWLERLLLLATPIMLLIVFFETTRQQNTAYRRIDDFEFYAPITSIHSSRGIYQLPRVFICGILVLEPQPLINHDELLRQTRLVNPRAYGLTVSSPGELCYPESLISYKGLTMLELTLLQIVLVGLLGLWLLLSGWNIISFALYHKRVQHYADYPIT